MGDKKDTDSVEREERRYVIKGTVEGKGFLLILSSKVFFQVVKNDRIEILMVVGMYDERRKEKQCVL